MIVAVAAGGGGGGGGGGGAAAAAAAAAAVFAAIVVVVVAVLFFVGFGIAEFMFSQSGRQNLPTQVASPESEQRCFGQGLVPCLPCGRQS